MHYGIGSGAGGGKSECAIPDGVTSILDGAFTGSSLRDLTIPGSAAFIEDDLFQDFTDLNSVTLLEGITGIGWDAFYNCHKLTRVVLPSTLEEIGDWAFHDCYSLEEVRYSGTDEQKAKMYIGEGNDYLTKLNWLYWLNHDHPYGDWFYSPEPTLYSDGMERRECKICEAFEKRAVPMLDVPAPAITVSAKSKTGEPVLKWESVDANCSYVIYRSTSKSSGFEYLTVTYKNTFTDSAAKIGTKYYYKGLTRLQDRESAFSDTVSLFVKLGKPAVTVSSTASTNGKPEIRWEDVPGAAKYYVYRSQEKSSGFARIGTSKDTGYRDKRAVPGETYYYKVKAIHGKTSSADSVYSEVVSRVCDLAKPEVSIKLYKNDPRLTWDKISGAEKYYVYRATYKDGEYTHVKTTKSSTSFTDTTAKAGKTYYYKVKAVHSNASANSAYSSVKYITAK